MFNPQGLRALVHIPINLRPLVLAVRYVNTYALHEETFVALTRDSSYKF